MANLLEQAIDCNDADRAARIIQDALCIESDEVTNYLFRKDGQPIASNVPGLSVNCMWPPGSVLTLRCSTVKLGARE
jgi:hypothetical protein